MRLLEKSTGGQYVTGPFQCRVRQLARRSGWSGLGKKLRHDAMEGAQASQSHITRRFQAAAITAAAAGSAMGRLAAI